MMVKLSVCIPSRNRQKYCIETIKSLAKSEIQDFEVIVGDNSDDGEPLASFVKELDDKRFKYVPPETRTLSMVENWDRLVQYTSGEWVSYIGDDDYIDPMLTKLIAGIQNSVPDVDAISWSAVNYVWPDIQNKDHKIKMPSQSDIIMLSQKNLLKRMFYWEEATDRPLCNFGVYHATVKRDLLERIKDTFGGQYFKQQIVDYENICKTILVAKKLIFCQRAMSVMGACKASNSASIIDPKLINERLETFNKETQQSKTGLLLTKDFPFPNELGLTAVVGSVILWVIQEYGLEVVGWEKNFIKACDTYCRYAPTKEDFEFRKAGYRKVIENWHGGIYLKYFNPEYLKKTDGTVAFQGVYKDSIYVDTKINNSKTPAEVFEALQCVMPSVDFILNQLSPARKAA